MKTFMIWLLLCGTAFAAAENLDETVLRKARRSTNTYYTGENCAIKGPWNPQSLQYIDILYGSEVWKMTDSANREAYFGNDIGYSPWSANGKHMTWTNTVTTSCFGGSRPKYFSNTDGSFLTPGYGASRRGGQYTVWSPSEPEVFYDFGSNGLGEGKDNRILYRNTLSSTNSITAENWLGPFPWSSGLYAPEDMYKGTISADGKKAVVFSSVDLGGTPVYPITLLPAGSKQIDDADGWLAPQFDTYWGTKATPTVDVLHDLYVGGAAATKIWWYTMPTDSTGDWWRMTFSGSAVDGGPLHTQDHTTPYSWGGEIEPIAINGSYQAEGSCSTNRSPWVCDNDANTIGNFYLSHFVPDRWGTKLLGGWEIEPCLGATVWNTETKQYDTPCIDMNELGHYNWNGWTDWIVQTPTTITDSNTLHAVNYKNEATLKGVAKVHMREGGSTSATYQSLPRVGQSPDGTKASFHSDFLGNVANQALDVYWTVVYYPYPPEIKSAAKNGSNVRLTWDFNQGTGCLADGGSPTPRTGDGVTPNLTTPRTYATRGWPHEILDCPPSPREIKQFRVWISADSTTWTPAGTTAYNNCSGTNECGMWAETAWTYDAAQANSTTRYYAVTSLEHSGLESRNLSNVWKVILDGSGDVTTQEQQTAYPADPGTKPVTAFFTTAPDAPQSPAHTYKKPPATADGQYTIEWTSPTDKTLIRHYNIYAKDGSEPTAIQQNRIASIPATSAETSFSYVDWLGNTDGSTDYIVTAVDFQGNESGSIPPDVGDAIAPVTTGNKSGRTESRSLVELSCTDDASCTSTLYCQASTKGGSCTPNITYSAPFKVGQNRAWYSYCYASGDGTNTESAKCSHGVYQRRR